MNPPAPVRLVLLWLWLMAAGLSLGCRERGPKLTITAVQASAEGTPSPPPVAPATLRIAAPEGLHDRIASAAARLSGMPRPELVAEGSESGLVVALTSPEDLAAPRLRTWVAVNSAVRIDVTGIRLEDLAAAAETGALYTPEPYTPLVRRLLPRLPPPRGIPVRDIPDMLDREPGSLALIPLDTLTTRVQALAVDGIDPARSKDELAAYPLVTRGRIAPAPGVVGLADTAAALTVALEMLDPPPVRITFTGDLIPTRCVYDRMRAAGDWAAPFRALAGQLAAADLTVGSLDAAISDRAAPIGCRETYSLLAPPQVTAGLMLAGYDALTVATNHVKDCGAAGFCGDGPFLDTLANLRAAGVAPFGGGLTLAAARRPTVLTVGDTRFAFLGYDDIARHYHAGDASPGTAPLDPATLAEDILHALEDADAVIVLPHWGEEYTPHPTQRQRQAAQTAISAGATLVVGNHPHVVQAAGPLADGYVAYALGNFVFDQDWSTETMEGVVLETAWLGPRLVAVRFLPVRIEGRLQPVLLNERDGQPILRRIMDAAARLSALAQRGR